MNFSEYKAYRDELLLTQSPQRLDCLNPFVAMAFTHDTAVDVSPASSDAAIASWCEAMGMEDDRRDVIAVEGVRAALASLFRDLGRKQIDLWLPQDVYPYYWETAKQSVAAPQIHSFHTLPYIDLEALDTASANATVLITNPVSPLGRYLSSDEVRDLKVWLAACPQRRLVLDTVYAYREGFDQSTLSLLDTGQVFVLHSLSKAWLQRGVWGAVVPPRKDPGQWKTVFEAPSDTSSGIAIDALARLRDLPDRQQALFDAEWNRLMPDLMRISGGSFRRPKSGYLGLIEVNAADALVQSNALVVPASVFGLSVVSCLYAIKSTYAKA
jgi:aspartate/methionine/tyrosine aminotransferase